MVLIRVVVCSVLLVLSACATPAAPDTVAERSAAVERRVLKASLYPYIPDAGAAYLAVERAFEARHPDVNLEVSLNGSYYSHDPADGGVLYEDADVYEIDSVFLADFVAAEKIRPLNGDWTQVSASLVPFARELASSPGGFIGMPHWLCGNFLIYRAGDADIGRARTLAELETALQTPDRPKALIADFYGRSTLGEMYLDALMDRHQSPGEALRRIAAGELDPDVLAAMQRAVALIRPSFGRDRDYHDRLGFYARQFARGEGRAFVGYSEQLHYALSESMHSCRKDEPCLKTEDVRVAEWPLADRGSKPIAWVDMFVVDADASGLKQADAERFIRFMMEPETYRLMLVPAWGQAPRYLLPARDDLYRDKALVDAAPLYPVFRERIERATPLTGPELNRKLREIGNVLNGRLPPN